jgi:hypothetical protein
VRIAPTDNEIDHEKSDLSASADKLAPLDEQDNAEVSKEE